MALPKLTFSLRALLILTAVLAVLLAGVNYELRRTRHEQAVEQRAIDSGLSVIWDNRWTRGRIRSMVRANFGNIHVSRSLAREIAGCYDLECLCFYRCTFEAGAIPEFARLRHLSTFWPAGSTLSETNIAELSQLAQINELCLSQCELPDQLKLQFAATSRLRELWLDETGVTLDDLRSFESCPGLTFWSIDNSQLREHDLVAFLKMTRPKMIGIDGGALSDEDLRLIVSHPGLEQIVLDQVEYSDSVLQQCLQSHRKFAEFNKTKDYVRIQRID